MVIPSKYKIKRNIWIEPDIYYSDAFRGLSKSAMLTLMRCLQKRKMEEMKAGGKKKYIPADNEFIFPYAEATDLRIAGNTQHWKNIRKLVEAGFLDISHQGGWYQKHEHEKDYSRYKLSERWRKYGTPEFKKVKKEKVLPGNFHVRANIKRKELKSTSLKRRGQLHKSEGEVAKLDNIRLHKSEDDKSAVEGPLSPGPFVFDSS